MKFGKEEIQKMFLGVLFLIGLLYCYFNLLLGSLNRSEQAANTVIHDRGQQLDTDKKTIKSAKDLKADAVKAEATLDQIRKLIPDGSPVAWFPPLATEFFKEQGIEKCAIHRGSEATDKDLTGFKELSWGLDVSRVEMIQLAGALAAFENEYPLMEIDTLHIAAGKDNVQFQTARLDISTIIKQ